MAITLDGNNLTTTGVINSGTLQVTTSGTSVDITGIPTGVKRVTVMLNGVSTNGTSITLIQLGISGGVETSGYLAMAGLVNTTNNTTRGSAQTIGFPTSGVSLVSSDVQYGSLVFTLFGSNTWICGGNVYNSGGANANTISGQKTLAGTLDRVRITTVNGTDTFDAGSINILYE